MRVSAVVGFLFATASFAAPIVELSELDITNSVPTQGLTKRLDTSSLGLTAVDLSEVEKITEVAHTEDLGLSKRLLGLDGLLDTVNGLLSDVLGLTTELEDKVSDILAHLEDLDVEGVLGDVLGLVNSLLAKVQKIASEVGVDLDLSELQPTVDILNKQVNDLVGEIQDLIDNGVTGDLVDEIKSLLEEVITLIENLSLGALTKA